MNLELLFFLLKVSVFIYLSLGCGIIIFFPENKRRGLFLLFVSICNLIIYYIWKNKLKISEPSFLTDKKEFVMSIFIFTAIGFVIVGLLVIVFLCFYPKIERKKLRDMKPELEGLGFYELLKLYNRYHDASVTFFGNKVIDEELYGEALKIKEKIKDKWKFN